MTTGNSVADYKTKWEYCKYCNGTGVQELSYDQLRNYLEHRWSYTYKRLMSIYRHWKKSCGDVICEECGGNGNWEVKY